MERKLHFYRDIDTQTVRSEMGFSKTGLTSDLLGGKIRAKKETSVWWISLSFDGAGLGFVAMVLSALVWSGLYKLSSAELLNLI